MCTKRRTVTVQSRVTNLGMTLFVTPDLYMRLALEGCEAYMWFAS